MPLPQITATGNLTRDPELRFLADGTPVASLTVACSKSKKDDAGNWQTLATVFLDVNLWRADAETAAAEYGEAMESRELAREADALADAIAATRGAR